jgi:hypothetical protein
MTDVRSYDQAGPKTVQERMGEAKMLRRMHVLMDVPPLSRPERHEKTRDFQWKCGSAGALGRNRTCDLRFRKPSLYPLSYEGGPTQMIRQISLFRMPAHSFGGIDTAHRRIITQSPRC